MLSASEPHKSTCILPPIKPSVQVYIRHSSITLSILLRTLTVMDLSLCQLVNLMRLKLETEPGTKKAHRSDPPALLRLQNRDKLSRYVAESARILAAAKRAETLWFNNPPGETVWLVVPTPSPTPSPYDQLSTNPYPSTLWTMRRRL